jgi:hypothetical protein
MPRRPAARKSSVPEGVPRPHVLALRDGLRHRPALRLRQERHQESGNDADDAEDGDGNRRMNRRSLSNERGRHSAGTGKYGAEKKNIFKINYNIL